MNETKKRNIGWNNIADNRKKEEEDFLEESLQLRNFKIDEG